MLHVICGPPCSGKSTYVREHAKDGDLLVDYDVIAQAFGCSEPHQARRACTNPNLAAFVARRAVIEWALDHAEEVEGWIIHTNPLQEDMDAYEQAGAEIVTLDTDIDTCLARCESDSRPPGTEDAIREWFANHQTAPKGAFFMPVKGGAMETKYKSFDVKAEAISEDGGTITGYASTWDREPDSYGDVVAKGAFTDTLADWSAKGARIPFLFGHRTDDPKYNIGWCEAEEDEHGLKFTAYLDAESEKAQYVRKLYKEGRIYQFSFAYAVLDAGPVQLDDGFEAYELRKLDLYEISAVQIPANQHAEVIDVKDAPAEIKAGRRNSKADEDELNAITEHAKAIQSIVNGLLAEQRQPDEQEPEAEADEAKANAEEQTKANEKSEEPTEANAEEPETKSADVDALLQEAIQLLEKEA